MSSTQQAITEEELNVLKRFAMTWIAVYHSIPPKELLGLFLLIHRINKQIQAMQKSIAAIHIAQAPTVAAFHAQAVANMHNQRSMMR